MTDISLRRAALLGRIWAYKQEHDYPPALRDLMDREVVGQKGLSSLRFNLDVLQGEGYVTWDAGKARTIRLTVKGEALCQ